jgi:hypothetical protein
MWQPGERVQRRRLRGLERLRALAREASIHPHRTHRNAHQPADVDTRRREQPVYLTGAAATRDERIPPIRAFTARSFQRLDLDSLAIFEQAGSQPFELFRARLTACAHGELDPQLRELAHQRLGEIAVAGEQLETAIVRRQWTDRYPASARASR